MPQTSAAVTTARPTWLPSAEELDTSSAELRAPHPLGPLTYDPLTAEEHEWFAEAAAAARELEEELAIR